ncbi:IS1/IS1595 family N-terminal zinc-binding domain-containing protein [Pyrococcus kukulkanii]|uniref:Transposase n=1 Tax=Pyrococcus kukulkanii TaxID=1609559 RepID=A0ABV4T533_9EURY
MREEVILDVQRLLSLTDEEVVEAVRKLRGRVRCPYCGSLEIVKIGFIKRHSGLEIRRFKCKNCGRTFNELDGTPLSGVHSLRRIVLIAYFALYLKFTPSTIMAIVDLKYPTVVRLYRKVTENKEFFNELLELLLNEQ